MSSNIELTIEDNRQGGSRSQNHGTHGGHSHHHKKGKKNDMKHVLSQYGFGIRAFNYIMILNVVLLELFLVLPPLTEANSFEYHFNAVFITFIGIMCVISFYQCSNIRSHVVQHKSPPEHTYFRKPKNAGMCLTCNAWKPQRAHHCSVCNRCTLKMDHHCPWVDNCVGAHNHKAFALYCVFMATGTVHFMYQSFCLVYNMIVTGNVPDINTFFFIYWGICAFICLPMGCMLVGLSFFHPMMGLTNATTLEQMGGSMMRAPCNDQDKPITMYDNGYIGNFIRFFGDNYFTWWFPTRVDSHNDFTYYDNHGLEEANPYFETRNSKNPVEFMKYSNGNRDYSAVLEAAEKECKGKTVQLNGKTFEISS